MTTAKQQAMIWMNTTFGADIEKAVKNTAIPKNLLIAIGIQETYYIWAGVYKTGTVEDVLGLCVGDTLDYPKRKTAWPKNRAELEAHPKGAQMFKIARDALVRIAEVNSGYKTVVKNPDKFCHGFGMFQYDIQFFKKEDSNYFLNGDWMTWKGTLGKGIAELKSKLADLYGNSKSGLTHDESVYLAIAYNQGATKTKSKMATKKFKQGHRDGNGIYYGEYIDNNLKAMGGLW